MIPESMFFMDQLLELSVEWMEVLVVQRSPWGKQIKRDLLSVLSI